jgi:fibronectin-binding autotransporter adhesin
MKPKFNRLLGTSITVVVALSSSAWAVDRIKQNNTTALNLAGSWDTLPTSSDVAVFDSTYATTGILNTGALVTWQGIRVVSPGGNVIINNSTSGQELALGSAGIDMSAATRDLNIQRLRVDASQTWDIASGRIFNLGNSSTVRTGALTLGGVGTHTITKTGAGTVQLDTGNNAIGNVNWDIQAGVIRAIWNGSSAWGTGNITLGGGGIATGTSFSGSVGNWTWNNNITLTNSTSSFIDNQNIAGTDRSLKLTGAISGSGNLEFRDTGTGFTNANFGHILAGNNSNTGTVTIASGAEVRVGGNISSGTDTAHTGNNGKLAGDTALVVNNGTLSFSRLDAHTVANNISGSGSLRIGLNATLGTATTTQAVTLSGANTYSGETTVNNGRLNLTGSLASNISVLAGGNISGTGSTTGTLTTAATSGIRLTGGSTFNSLVANGVTIGGTTSISFLTNPTAATSYDVFTYGAGGLTGFNNLTAAWRGTLSEDTANQKVVFLTGNTALRTWTATSGTWDNTGTNTNWAEGDNKFYDGDDAVFGNVASDATVTLSSNIAAGSVLVQNSANSYTFSGSALTGAGGLTKANGGTLILTNTNLNSGNTTVTGGVLDVGNGGTSGSLGSGAISVGSGAELVFNRSNAFTVSNEISGDGLVTKKGAGRMTVNGNNSGAAVNWNFAGTGNADIGFQNANAVGGSGSSMNLATNATGSFFFNTGGNNSAVAISLGSGSTLTLNGSTGNTNTLSGEISGSGNITKTSGETLILSGTNTYGGNTTISGGALQIGGSGVLGNGSYAGAIANSGVLFMNTGSNQTLSGTISGGGRLDKSNTGELTLSSSNSYSGGTEHLGGTLRVNALSGIGSGYLAIKNGSTFVYQGSGSETTTRNLFMDSGAATIEVTNASASLTWNDAAAKNGTFTKSGAGALVLGGAISGAGGSVAVSGGTLTLSGTNTYTGATTVSAGTLLVSGALGNTAVTVENSATIGGSGSLGGTLAMLGGGKLDVTGATLGLSSTGILSVAVGRTMSFTDFGFASIVGWDWANAEVGTYTLIGGGGTVSLLGTTPTVSSPFDFGNGKSGYFQEGSLQAVIIPEPRAALLGGIGLLALLRRRRSA